MRQYANETMGECANAWYGNIHSVRRRGQLVKNALHDVAPPSPIRANRITIRDLKCEAATSSDPIPLIPNSIFLVPYASSLLPSNSFAVKKG